MIRASNDDGEQISIELIGLCTDICVVSNALIFQLATVVFANGGIAIIPVDKPTELFYTLI